MTEAALERRECEACGALYFPSSQSEDCPHEYISSFTKALRNQLRELLSKDGRE